MHHGGANYLGGLEPEQIKKEIKKLEDQMHKAAADLEFERVADLRDQIRKLEAEDLGFSNRPTFAQQIATAGAIAGRKKKK